MIKYPTVTLYIQCDYCQRMVTIDIPMNIVGDKFSIVQTMEHDEDWHLWGWKNPIGTDLWFCGPACVTDWKEENK